MVPSSSLISRPIVFRDPDFVINYWQNNENKTFPAAEIYVKCSCAPGCRNFFLCSYSTGCREAIHDEFLLAELSKCVTVSDVLKYLAADKCNEWMNEWMKKWNLKRINFKPMFLLSLLTNKDSYSVSQKSSPPLKLFAIFSLVVNLCYWKLSWLLPKHVSMFTPILVHLSEYLYELYHFY